MSSKVKLYYLLRILLKGMPKEHRAIVVKTAKKHISGEINTKGFLDFLGTFSGKDNVEKAKQQSIYLQSSTKFARCANASSLVFRARVRARCVSTTKLPR